MPTLQAILKNLDTFLKNFPVFSSFPFALLLIGLEELIELNFSCPCKYELNKYLTAFIFTGPPLFAFTMMFIALRPCNYGWCLINKAKDDQQISAKRNKAGDDQQTSARAKKGGDDQQTSARAKKGGDDQQGYTNANKAGDDQLRYASANKAGDDQLSSAKASKGGNDQLSSAKASKAGDDRLSSAKASKAGDDRQSSAKASKPGDDQLSSAKASKGGNDQLSSAKASKAGDDRLSSAKASKAGDDRQSSAKASKAGDDRLSSAKASEGGDDQHTSAKANKAGDDQQSFAKVNENKDYHQNCWKALGHCLIPPVMWIITALIDGDYVACGLTKWKGTFVYDKELNRAWCKPIESANAGNQTDLRYEYQGYISISMTLGYAMLAVFSVVTVFLMSMYDCFKSGKCDYCRGTQRVQQDVEQGYRQESTQL
nr:uncharacterized protein LOC129452630 [Misgurnus anguillicaudatus]